MSHEIMARDSMFSANGETPWHKLGRVIPGQVRTAADAIAAAGLDWHVSLAALRTDLGADVPMARAVVRDDTAEVLGVVGTGFRVLQNRDAFAAFDPWAAEGILTYETAGSLRNGGRVWILARLALDSMSIGKGDDVAAFALLAHGHDGSLAIRVKGTCVRVVCANTLAASLLDGAVTQRFTHRGDVVGKAANAVASLDGIREAAESQAAIYRALTNAGPKDDDAVLDYLAAVFQESSESLAAKGARKAPAIADLFEGNAIGAGLATSAGTYWGLYNALTEYLTHHAGGGNGERAGKRAESSVWGSAAGDAERGLSVAYVLGHDLATADEAKGMDTSELDNMLRVHAAARAA